MWLQLTSKCNQLQPKSKMAVCKLLKMVARDGFGEHYTALTIPLTGIRLDPRLELNAA